MTTRATIGTLTAAASAPRRDTAHHWHLVIVCILAGAFLLAVAVYGFDYYTLGATARPLSPKHAMLRPSGSIGIKLGMLGTALFFGIYFYYFRKHWGWLRNLGTTKHWLDMHIVMGVTAPLVIAFHSAFKFRGIAGMAFWIMVAVALSGVVGRYLYGQIPRHLNAAELSWQELQQERDRLTAQLASQKIFTEAQVTWAFRFPTVSHVKHLSAISALVYMFWLDLIRPFRVAALRRRALGFFGILVTLGGLFPSGRYEIERVIRTARHQATLTKRMLFLSRTQQVFQLWHVVHRPFSYAFVVLALLHIATAMLLGYL